MIRISPGIHFWGLNCTIINLKCLKFDNNKEEEEKEDNNDREEEEENNNKEDNEVKEDICLSEIIRQQENECCGGDLAWISNFHFYNGIAA